MDARGITGGGGRDAGGDVGGEAGVGGSAELGLLHAPAPDESDDRNELLSPLKVARRVFARWRAFVAARKGAVLLRLLEEWRDVLMTEVLARLDPTDRTMLAQVGRPWLAAVLASGLPRLPKLQRQGGAGLHYQNPFESAHGLSALTYNTSNCFQTLLLNSTCAATPRVRLKLSAFCTSVDRLVW